jgi:hypothetical protein
LSGYLADFRIHLVNTCSEIEREAVQMKTKIMIALLAIAASLAVTPGMFVPTVAAARRTAAVAHTPDMSYLSPELVVPAVLPAAIADSRMLEAWIRLYNRQATVELWDGRLITGRDLALFLLDQRIPVVWDTKNVCHGGSCSVKVHTRGSEIWTFEDEAPRVEPIYVRVEYQTDMPSLVTTLAHEAFHRTLPFGAVGDSRFEEYWAYLVERTASPEGGLKFGQYDPYDPGQLAMWFTDNRLVGYGSLPAYPPSVQPLWGEGATAASIEYDSVPSAAFGAP